ncbi:MAG: N-acetylmuramoyl-L-alanine amidase [Alcaligenaceae bacterium]|jgi:N-acetylmuramoyl-L-alanine amidase
MTQFFLRPYTRLALVLSLLILAGCASQRTSGPYLVDDSLKATGKNSRIDIIVLHYTASSKQSALLTLTNRDVSSHYVVSDDSKPVVYKLVEENLNAWHAGDSSWYGKTDINPRSIGIEIVHPGWTRNSSGDIGPAYPPAQIDAVIALTLEVAKRHGVSPENVVGHSDVAPLRKQDPGPAFPWKKLAQAGVGRWYDEAAAAKYQAEYVHYGPPDAGWFQKQLKRVGYGTPETNYFDANTLNTLAAFQMHYRPELVNGRPDAQTAARLRALPTKGSGL